MMMGGMVMVGGIILNKSPVDLTMVTPIARLTSEYVVIVVPANSPHKTMGDLVKAFKADPGKVSWGGGSAGGTDHILVGLIAKAVGADPRKINYVPLQGRRRGDRRHRRRPRHRRRIAGWASSPSRSRRAGCARSPFRRPPRSTGIPTLKEQGVDVVLGNWRGVFGGAGDHDGAARRAGQRRKDRDRIAGLEGNRCKVRLGRRGSSPAMNTRRSSTRTSSASARIIDSLGLKK